MAAKEAWQEYTVLVTALGTIAGNHEGPGRGTLHWR